MVLKASNVIAIDLLFLRKIKIQTLSNLKRFQEAKKGRLLIVLYTTCASTYRRLKSEQLKVHSHAASRKLDFVMIETNARSCIGKAAELCANVTEVRLYRGFEMVATYPVAASSILDTINRISWECTCWAGHLAHHKRLLHTAQRLSIISLGLSFVKLFSALVTRPPTVGIITYKSTDQQYISYPSCNNYMKSLYIPSGPTSENIFIVKFGFCNAFVTRSRSPCEIRLTL